MSTNLRFELDLISILFYLYWCILGYIFYKFTKSKNIPLIICNIPAFITLILILFQEIIIKHYWPNDLGFSTQYFYFPTLRVAFYIKPNYLHYMWQTYIISFLLMVAASCIGCYFKEIIKQCKNLAHKLSQL
jgi:hypothetical protein